MAFYAPVLREGVRHRWALVLLLLTVFPVLAAAVGGWRAWLPFVDTSLWGGLMLDVILRSSPWRDPCRSGSCWRSAGARNLRVVRVLSVGLHRGMARRPAVDGAVYVGGGGAVVSARGRFGGSAAARHCGAGAVQRRLHGGGGARRAARRSVRQEEAAESLGLADPMCRPLSCCRRHSSIIVPGIINTVVDLFKDTTLVTIIGLFDLLAGGSGAEGSGLAGFRDRGLRLLRRRFFVCCLRCLPTGAAWNAGLRRASDARRRKRWNPSGITNAAAGWR